MKWGLYDRVVTFRLEKEVYNELKEYVDVNKLSEYIRDLIRDDLIEKRKQKK